MKIIHPPSLQIIKIKQIVTIAQKRIPQNGNAKHSGRIIPLNQSALNRKFGKHKRFGGRFEWNLYKFNKGTRTRTINYIRKGKRQSTVGILIKSVVYNALYCNSNYNTDYDLEDVLTTVCSIIKTQFIEGKQFIKESYYKIESEAKSEFFEAKVIGWCDYYEKISTDCHKKKKYKYTPREESLLRIFWLNKDKFESLQSYEEVQNFMGVLSDGIESDIKQLKTYYSKYIINKHLRP